MPDIAIQQRIAATAANLAALAILAALALIASCSSLPRHRDEVPAEWIEGKAYTAEISFEAGKKLDLIRELDLEYVTPSGERHTIIMDRSGDRFSATIPASDVAVGRMPIVISADVDKKIEKFKKLIVTVLSLSQAREKRQNALMRRMAFSYEAEVPFYRGMTVTLKVASPGKDGRLIFAQRKGKDSGYVIAGPTGNDGVYSIPVPASDLAEGYSEFYLEYSETDPDLGTIKANPAQGRDASNPFRVRVIGRTELEGILADELRDGFAFKPDSLASVYYDQAVAGRLDPSSARFLKEIIQGAPELSLCVASPAGAVSELPIPLRDGAFSTVISADALSRGADRYYFKLLARTSEMGEVEAAFPPEGAKKPIALNVLGPAQTEAKIVAEISAALKLSAPSSVKETEDLTVEASFSGEPAGLFARASSLDGVSLELVSSSSSFKGVRETRREMRRSGSVFRASVPSAELRHGADRYRIDVSARTNTALGDVGFSYPGSSASPWTVFSVITIEDMRASERSALAAMVASAAAAKSDPSGGLDFTLRLSGPLPDGHAFLFVRKPGDKRYIMKDMTQSGSSFAARLSDQEVAAGYRFYYFVLSRSDPELGAIEASWPAEGPNAPLEYLEPKAPPSGSAGTAKGEGQKQ